MQFTQHASVLTVDGKEVGRIDRVVIHPKTKVVTHIVIRKGFLSTEEKVVPMDLIALGQEERITLRMDGDALERLPDFEEAHYVVSNEKELGRNGGASDMAPALYWYPPYGDPPAVPRPEPELVGEIRVNIPEGTVAVKEGAKVVTREGEHIGEMEQVLTSAKADRATHLLVSRGLLRRERKLVPAEWIDNLGEEEVRLAVGSKIVEGLG